MSNYTSIKGFLEVQIKNLTNAMNPDKVLRQAVVTLVPEMKNRIQQDGKKSDGTQIGVYSDKTITGGPIASRFGQIATKKQISARMKAFGDTTEFYGYKDFRASLGRQTAFIDLTLTGDMMRDLKAGPTGPTSYGAGFLSNEQRKIANFNEEKFGLIFDPTDQELKQSLVTINKAIQKELSK
jgi:hypothetical protein